MKNYFRLLGVYLLVAFSNHLVWFALTFWAYLTTQSVVATGVIGGAFTVLASISSFWFGSLVDHYRKKMVMFGSSIVSLLMFGLGFVLLSTWSGESFSSLEQPHFWFLIIPLLLGTVVGGLYQITVPTLVTVLVPEADRPKANGMLGMVMGIAFACTSVASGLLLAHFGLPTVLMVAMSLTVVAMLTLSIVPIPEQSIIHTDAAEPKQVDVRGTIKVIGQIPGMFGLIFFTTFNNFVGGVFMALMDAYGLSLVSVQTWGSLWGFLSFGFIFGGMAIAKWGLGANPLKTLFKVNTAIWLSCMIFPLQPSIVLVAMGAMVWMSLFPYVEAIEQTIVQKVVPAHRQGRVFGFAHSVEQAASPLTAFMIGPIAQYFFIPLMSEGGLGAQVIGSWFGIGAGRGIALVFIMAGALGLVVTSIARRSKSYAQLSEAFVLKKPAQKAKK